MTRALATTSSSLPVIQSAAAERIAQLSTSELAPILNSAQRRFPFAPAVTTVCLIAGIFTFLSNDEVLLGAAVLFTAVFVPVAIYLDRYRRSVRIEYLLDDITGKIANALSETFGDLKGCGRVWSIRAQGATADWKRNAGANTLVKRQIIHPCSTAPSCIRGNVTFPCITLGSEKLYFLPDGMLVCSRSVTALQYKDFSTSVSTSRFMEAETVPQDAQIVDQSWKYVNKKGGPDRRFNFNKQIPVCIYGEMTFRSAGGLDGLIQFSNASGATRFAKMLDILRTVDPSASQWRAIRSFQVARRWPSVTFSIVFLAAFAVLGLALVHNGQLAHVPQSGRIPLTAPLRVNEQPSKPKAMVQPARNELALPPPLIITPKIGHQKDSDPVPSAMGIPLPRPRPTSAR